MKTKVGSLDFAPKKIRHYATSTIAVVVAVGLAGAALAGMNASLTSRDMLLSRAQTAADAFSAQEVSSLDGSFQDAKTSTYKNIKQRLARIKTNGQSTRFAYLVNFQDSRVHFLADSEPEDSANYSPPGQYYPDATPELIAAFGEDRAFIEGPVRDSYGMWFSALAPVVDQSTGKTVALLGLDTPARDYYSFIALRTIVPLLLAAIPVLVLVRNRKLEAKEREITELKTQFVAIASHELRSPLSGTLWGVQTLLKPNAKHPLNDDQRTILYSVYNNTAASIATVNEILDFSIFERGTLQIQQKELVNMVEVMKDVEKLFTLSAQENSIKIKYVGKWPERIPVIGDPNALKRAISNIFSNAIKYSPSGEAIELGYHTERHSHTIGVRDYGIGIPKHAQAKVLKGYYRAPNATKVKTHGTGMGLWVTKMIIEQHHGKLRLTSEPGSGTTVFITLPIHNATHRAQQ